jgi:hypothetical protein
MPDHLLPAELPGACRAPARHQSGVTTPARPSRSLRLGSTGSLGRLSGA